MIDFRNAIDVTMPIRAGMLLYPGDHAPSVRRLQSLEKGDPLTVSELTINCHVGTHVDAPAHFILRGATVDKLQPKHFFGEATVIDITQVDHVTHADLRQLHFPRNRHIVLKTRNSTLLRRQFFTPDYCTIHRDAVAHILDHMPLSIGIDYYSLDPPRQDSFPGHVLAAEAGIPVFVCLDLNNVAAGSYGFAAFGLPIAGAEGVQVRAFLSP